VSSDMDSWARVIDSYDKVPEAFQAFIRFHDFFPYIIYAPSDNWGRRRTNAKLICLYNDEFRILEQVKDKVNEACYYFHDIQYIETGTILLYSWICVDGLVDHKNTKSVVEFNSTVRQLFQPLIEKLRAGIHQIKAIEKGMELAKLDYLGRLNYKFFNYSHDAILSGEKIVYTLYQPDIYIKYLKFFHRIQVSACLLIVTDKELIIIQDDERNKNSNHKKGYGGIWVYIPLKKITGLSLDYNEEKALILLTIDLCQHRMRLFFGASQFEQLNSLVACAQQFID